MKAQNMRNHQYLLGIKLRLLSRLYIIRTRLLGNQLGNEDCGFLVKKNRGYKIWILFELNAETDRFKQAFLTHVIDFYLDCKV